MIRRSFQLVPGIGPSKEKALWERGLVDWDRFRAAGQIDGFGDKVVNKIRVGLERAEALLVEDDLATLAHLLPQREHWRLYPPYADEACYFDIETDGRMRQAPTVVTLFHGGRFEIFLLGRNMDDLPAALAKHRVWVTFNGSCFDVPVLEQYFGKFPKPALHLDLRFICKRLGWHGGLKSLEDKLGFSRPRHLLGVNGMDAVLLWRAYKRAADLEALRFLVEYNLYDAVQLRTLMDRAYNHGLEQFASDLAPLRVFDRGDVLYDVSKYLLELGPTPDDRRLLERIRKYDRDVNEE